MRFYDLIRAVALGALVAAGACDDAGPSVVLADVDGETTGATVSISVQPLSLETTTQVCYALEVWNGKKDDFGFPNPERVWARDGVCSGTFGNGAGGGITYVGTCDASEPDNFVTLGIENVYGQGGVGLVEGQEWFNPCPLNNRCELYATCSENRDTPVVFNLTIMRSANQGFFDVAVRFDQVYCSGKIDCSYDLQGDDRIKLLHNANGDRDATAVVSLACTTGPWLTDNTEIYLNHLRVNCAPGTPGGPSWTLAPAVTGAEGNQWDAQVVPPGDAIWQYATYFGTEQLYCDGLPCGKKYVDIAVGFDPTAVGCRLEVEMTVARPGVFNNFTSPANAVFPVLVGRVQLTPEAGEPSGVPLCRKGGLNAPWSGFYTTYTAMEPEGQPFCYRYVNGAFEARPGSECDQAGYYDYLSVQPLACDGSEPLHTADFIASFPSDFGSTCENGPLNPRFSCDPWHFVDASRICDGATDCPLGQDEAFGACPTQLNLCDAGATAFSGSENCDGIPDCLDGADETGVGCGTTLIACGSGVGYHAASQQCDAVLDCRNGFDEGAGGSPYDCQPPLFLWSCATGDQVITFDQQCNGWPECDDGSDEIACP